MITAPPRRLLGAAAAHPIARRGERHLDAPVRRRRPRRPRRRGARSRRRRDVRRDDQRHRRTRGRRGDRRRRPRRGRRDARVQPSHLHAHRVRGGPGRDASLDARPRRERRAGARARSRTISSPATRSPTTRRSGACAPAANDALARGAWEEAARYFEAALTLPAPAGRAGRAAPAGGHEPAGQPAAGAGGGPLRGRARAGRARRRRRHPRRAPPLAHPLRHRDPGDARGGRRPRSARGAGRRGRGRRPRARGRGAGRAGAVVLGRVAHEAGRRSAPQRAMAIADEHDDHSAYARATTAL